MSKKDATDKDFKAVRKCGFKGCKKTSNECVIKCKGCPEHYEIMKERSRKQRITHYHQASAKKHKTFHHKIDNNHLSLPVLKELSYEKDVLRSAIRLKYTLPDISECNGSMYKCLQRNGVCMAQNLVDITEDAYDEFTKAVSQDAFKFEKMFTDLTVNGKTKILAGDGPNRWILDGNEFSLDLKEWSRFEGVMAEFAQDAQFPKRGAKNAPKVDFEYNVFKTAPLVMDPQTPHTDEYELEHFNNNSKTFPIVSITGVSETTLLYIRPLGWALAPVCLERGDTLFFRTDIAHAGAQNVTEIPNYRIHTFWKVEGWDDKAREDLSVKFAKCERPYDLFWDKPAIQYYFRQKQGD